jgi:hypothetical protein
MLWGKTYGIRVRSAYDIGVADTKAIVLPWIETVPKVGVNCRERQRERHR